jgi:hypothetical protein
MKGLSLTLTIVIIAIVLLVTALVIMTIFGGQMAQVLGILNPWSSAMLESNLCQQKCATQCQLTSRPTIEWNEIQIKTQTHPDGIGCDKVMQEAAGGNIGKCECQGLISE